MDLLQQSAQAWKEITEYRYLFTYGYKNQLYPINLTFSLEDYPHLAGFQYMKDISLLPKLLIEFLKVKYHLKKSKRQPSTTR